MVARFDSYLVEEKLLGLHDEEDSSLVRAAEFIYEEEGLQEGGPNVIQLEDLDAAPAKMDDLKADVQDPLEEINLGDSEHPRPVYINQLLLDEVKKKFIQLLLDNKDCFALDYEEMLGLPRNLVEHKLPIQPGFMPFKQPPRRLSTEVDLR